MRGLGCIVFATGLALAGAGGAGSAARAQGPQPAVAPAARVTVEIAAQPLADALKAFARQTGLQIAVESALVEGRLSPGVSGTLDVDDALSRLLAGSGLAATFTSAGALSVGLRQDSRNGPLQLDAIRVDGEAGTALSPVDGYVASRSLLGAKTDTPIAEIPQSISVVTAAQMEERAVQTVGEALAYTAGVTTGTRGDSAGQGGDNISIRGFGGTGTAGASSNEYWDGLAMEGTNYATSALPPYLFDRIEVLKGPTSVLFGQNQPGGIVNRVSKRPPADWQGEVVGRAGSFNTYELDVDVGGPLVADGSLRQRLVGVYNQGEAQTDYTGQTRTAVAPSLTWQPGPDTRLTLLASYAHDDVDGRFVKYVPADGSVDDSPYGRIPRSRFTGDPSYDEWDRKAYAVGYQFEHSFDPTWTVRQNARYYRNDLDLEAVYLRNLLADQRTISRSAFGAKEHSDSYTLDNQVEARLATGPAQHVLLLGLDLRRTDSGTERRFGAAPNLDLYAPVYNLAIAPPPVYQNLDTRSQQAGIYLQDQIKLDRWILTLGGRQDWAGNSQTNNLTGVETDSNAQAFTGRVGLGYAFANGLTPYLSWSQSFEPVGGTDFAGAAFEPTTGTQYEAGLKFEPSGTDARATLSIYQLAQENVLTSDPVNPGFSVQTGEVRSRGVELETVASLTESWNLTASYTYLDQVVTKSNGADLGKRLTGIPKHSANLWSDYRLAQGPLAGLGFGGGIRFVSGTMGDDINSFEVPAVTLFDAALSYDLGSLDRNAEGWRIAVNGRNLLDTDYVASCISPVRCYYGIGRTVMATLKYGW